MKFWFDAHLSPSIPKWITEEFGYEAYSLRGLGLRDEEDHVIFRKAKEEDVIFVSKDSDFKDYLDKYGSPPKLIWLRCGNTSNIELKRIFRLLLTDIMELLQNGNDLVEISNQGTTRRC